MKECEQCGGENSIDCRVCKRNPALVDKYRPKKDKVRACAKCGHTWEIKLNGKEPKICPRCKSYYWNKLPDDKGSK